jgi:hypothetical protein
MVLVEGGRAVVVELVVGTASGNCGAERSGCVVHAETENMSARPAVNETLRGNARTIDAILVRAACEVGSRLRFGLRKVGPPGVCG